MTGRVRAWLEERLGLESLAHLAEKKDVPVHRHTFWYYWGGMTLFLFGIQIATGILLLLYYSASADEAYESVRFIMTQVSFGWLIRSIHSWAANLMVGAAMIHMFSAFLLKSYRRPHEMTWLTGMALLGLSLAFGFSGYLLPWNQVAFFATKVGIDITGAVPMGAVRNSGAFSRSSRRSWSTGSRKGSSGESSRSRSAEPGASGTTRCSSPTVIRRRLQR